MNIIKKSLQSNFFTVLLTGACVFSAYSMENDQKSEISIQLQEMKAETERLAYLWKKHEIVTENDIQTYVQSMENIETKHMEGLTILILTCMKGFYETAQLLIEKGANVNNRFTGSGCTYEYGTDCPYAFCNRDSALTAAVRNNQDKIVELLMQNGAVRSDKDVMIAIDQKNHTALQFLLKNDTCLGKYNEKNNPSDTFLTLAVKKNALEIFKTLIQNGADTAQVNSNRYTPFIVAAQENCIDFLEYMLNNNPISQEDKNYALKKAVDEDALQAVEILLVNGANPNKGAVTRAIQRNKPKILKLLLDNSGVITQEHWNDECQDAWKMGYYEVMEIVIEYFKNKNSTLYANQMHALALDFIRKFHSNANVEKVKWLMLHEVDMTFPCSNKGMQTTAFNVMVSQDQSSLDQKKLSTWHYFGSIKNLLQEPSNFITTKDKNETIVPMYNTGELINSLKLGYKESNMLNLYALFTFLQGKNINALQGLIKKGRFNYEYPIIKKQLRTVGLPLTNEEFNISLNLSSQRRNDNGKFIDIVFE